MRNRDHTQANLLGSIAALSIPAIFMSLMGGALFQLVDLSFLGRLGDASLAAAGATNQTLRQFFFLMSFGLSVAAQMLIARFVGAGSIEGAEHVAGQTFLLGILLALFTAVIGFLFAEPLVALVMRDPEVQALATTYLRITFATLTFTIMVQSFSSVLNGAGDSTTPMLISFVITPMGILGEYTLAFGHFGFPEMGIAGIALGAGLGGFSGLLVASWALFSGRCRVHLRARHLKPDLSVLRRIVRSAWQPALHMLARTSMIFFFMWLASRIGGKVQAAFTIGLRLEMVPIMIAFPIANACATLVGQNLGANNLPRAWRSIWVTYGVQCSVLWPLGLFYFVFRHELVGAFTSDPEVAALAAEYLTFSSAILLTAGLYFTSFRALQAAGDMNSPMLISVSVAFLVGAPLGYYLATASDMGARGMWIGNLVYAYVNAALMVGWLMTGRWSHKHARSIA
ncbi:MAG: MATE family efflux transporter [bacterium]|nr:MATE family efflux transporter [bacterium]